MAQYDANQGIPIAFKTMLFCLITILRPHTLPAHWLYISCVSLIIVILLIAHVCFSSKHH